MSASVAAARMWFMVAFHLSGLLHCKLHLHFKHQRWRRRRGGLNVAPLHAIYSEKQNQRRGKDWGSSSDRVHHRLELGLQIEKNGRQLAACAGIGATMLVTNAAAPNPNAPRFCGGFGALMLGGKRWLRSAAALSSVDAAPARRRVRPRRARRRCRRLMSRRRTRARPSRQSFKQLAASRLRS